MSRMSRERMEKALNQAKTISAAVMRSRSISSLGTSISGAATTISAGIFSI